MKATDEDEKSRFYEKTRESWDNNAVAQKLLKSGALGTAVRLLKDRERVQRRYSPKEPLDIWVVQAATGAARERDIAERMTASERRKLENTIRESTDALLGALTLLHGEAGFTHHFQPVFDGLALDMACNQKEWCEDAGIPMDEETLARCRFTVYQMLMHDLGTLFDAIKYGAELFSQQETIVKKPNDKNANRLYFIRKLNSSLCGEFDSPCRSAALAITSAFFDCSDLDEAALSKLAPRKKPKPHVMPQEGIDRLREYFAANGRLSELEEIDPIFRAESKSENGPKSSAE